MHNTENIPVLDHGYVRLVDSWGSDENIIESARMSTGKGFQGWGPIHEGECMSHDDSINACDCTPKPGDEKLLAYLWNNKHHTPFEMAGMIIEVQAPLFVFREWHRHRTQSYNELSARYTQMPNLHYVPSVERIMTGGQDTKNKQGSTNLEISLSEAETIQTRLMKTQQLIYDEYAALINVVKLSKELSRINTPVSRYSRMRASANLRNWLAFLTLRLDSAAQWEIRQYASVVGKLVSEIFPRTWALFGVR